MALRKSSFVSPDRNTLFAVAATSVSFCIFAYSTIIGPAAILAFYLIWFTLVLLDYRYVLAPAANSILPWCLPVFCMLSTFWSAEPELTLRASTQLLTHVLCATIAARTVSVRSLCLGSIIGVWLVLFYSLLVGRYGYDAVDGSYSFIGAFASKNQLGFFASLGVFFSISFAVAFTKGLYTRILCILSALVTGACLILSDSATSLIVTPFAVLIVLLAAAASRFTLGSRTVLGFLGLSTGILLLVLAALFGLAESVPALFGKDSTLTGRTYLWSEGIRIGGENPLIGQGYNAFWVVEHSDAERLWAEFYIDGRYGFHFHNTFIEAFVELGSLGVALLVVVFLAILLRCLRRLTQKGSWADPGVLLGLLAMLVARSMVEVDAFSAFQIGSFLLFYALTSGKRATFQAKRRPLSQPLLVRLEHG